MLAALGAAAATVWAAQPSAGATAPDPAATAPVYRVELVVFRAVAPAGAAEDWSAEAAADGIAQIGAPESAGPNAGASVPAASASAEAASKDSAPSPPQQTPAERSDVSVLPAGAFRLDAVAARLKESGRYVPIAEAAWTQLASPWGRPIAIPLASLGIVAPGLEGTLALERGEFLHLTVHLAYTLDDPAPGLGAAPGTVFVLDQTRRVRLEERNYFDHPAFGVIAVVTRVEPRRAPRD